MTTETDIKERPIIFSGEMVRAILDRRKTQTRRVIKPQPSHVWTNTPSCKADSAGNWFMSDHLMRRHVELGKCPYGKPGDRLWVRETFQLRSFLDPFPPSDASTGPHEWRTSHYCCQGVNEAAGWGRVRPSIHMPRWASRITLEVTDVRVERVQEISDEDSVAEGAWAYFDGLEGVAQKAFFKKVYQYAQVPLPSSEVIGSRHPFAALWDSINAKRGYPWEDNPWVWVVEFKVL